MVTGSFCPKLQHSTRIGHLRKTITGKGCLRKTITRKGHLRKTITRKGYLRRTKTKTVVIVSGKKNSLNNLSEIMHNR